MKKILKQKYITNEDILEEPNELLSQKAEEVKMPLSKEDSNLLRIMYNHVSNSQNKEYSEKFQIRPAVGIAAPQLGVLKKMIAIKTVDEDGNIHKYTLVNPKFTFKSEEMCYLFNGEGCLSVEEGKYKGIVPRHQHVVIEAFNLLTNKVETIDAEDYLAIVLQHEMDHLDGVLYIDKINKLDPSLAKEEWKKI